MALFRNLTLMCILVIFWWIEPIFTTTIHSISKKVKPTNRHVTDDPSAVLRARQTDTSPCATAEKLTTTKEMTTSFGYDRDSLIDSRTYFEYQESVWFRLDGEGGTEILDSKPPKTNICNARYPGYIKYREERQGYSGQEVQTEATLCHLSGHSDCVTPSPILIHKCENYFVYKITKSNVINEYADFFCTQKSRPSPKPSDPCKTRERLTTTNEMTTSFGYERDSIIDPRARLEYQLDTWFRLDGEGGTEILDSKPRSTHLCNARYPGYIKYQEERKAYSRPRVETRATLCHLSDNSECVEPSPILIHKCENYFVYKITKVNIINENADFFCTQKSSTSPKPSDPCKTRERLLTSAKMMTSFGYDAKPKTLLDPRGTYEYQLDIWFRLDGEGGTEILDSKPLTIYLCNSRYPGYIKYRNGRKSGSRSGTTIEATLCHLDGRSDCTSPSPILIHQCKNYLVYKITKMNYIPEQPDFFCTQTSGQKPESSDPCNTREILLTTAKMTTSFGYGAQDPESDRRWYYEYEVRAWFRLQGEGGVEILSQKPRSTNKCNTRYPGWIKYDAAFARSKRQGGETRAKLCHINGEDGCFAYVEMLVHKCKDYLVYKSTGEGSYFDAFNFYFCTQTSPPPTTPTPTTTTIRTPPTRKPTPSKKPIPSPKPTSPPPSNECANNPCGRHGTCFDVGTDYECVCKSGFSGRHCETNIDDCESSPCLYGGTCTDGIADYTCSCATGFTGKKCEENVNDCSSNPCKNGGKCVDGVNGYYCFCALGYTGTNCETNENNCVSTVCQNGGTCRDGVNSYKCECASGFEGKNCEKKKSPCQSGPCRNGATCEDRQNTYACICPSGYTGNNCETKFTNCDSQPCKNGATCTSTLNSYACTCLPGWSGKDCDNDDKLDKFAKDIDDLVKEDNTFSMDDLYNKVDDVMDYLSDAASNENDDSLTDKIGNKVENAIRKFVKNKLGKTFDKVKDKLSNLFCGGLNLGSAANNFKKTYNKCLKERQKKCQEEGKKEREENGEETEEENEEEGENEEETETENEEEEKEEEKEEEQSCNDKCFDIQDIANGKFEASKFDCGYSVSFSCNEGYELKGCDSNDCKITCERGGEWSSQPPTCEKKTCGGFITLSSAKPQAELSFTGTNEQRVECTWVVITATQEDMNIDFPQGFNVVSSRITSCDNYVEIGFGPEIVKYCKANRGVQRSFSNMITVKLHAKHSSQVKFNVRVSIVNNFFESDAAKRSFLGKRNDRKRKRAGECQVYVNTIKWPVNPPILADPVSKSPIFPDKTSIADKSPKDSKITLNSELKALCSQSKFYFNQNQPVSLVTLKCKYDDKVFVKYTKSSSASSKRARLSEITDEYDFDQLSCDAPPKTEVIKLNGASDDDHKLVWNFEAFVINVIDKIKYDKNSQRPVCAKETVRGETLVMKREGEPVRPDFKKTPVITDKQMDPNIYPKNKQRSIFTNIDPTLESKIDCCNDKYLVHGHLVPNADFYYKSWRDATFYMTNAAPQWQSINAGNWLKVENAVREYAKAKGKDMTATTGTYGTLQIDGKDIVLPGNIPVPSHFWKVLYDPNENAAVAFVIVNNPHAKPMGDLPTGSDKLCTAQCSLLATRKPTPLKGLLMCCSPSDLHTTIPDVPTYSLTTKNLFNSAEMEKALKSVN